MPPPSTDRKRYSRQALSHGIPPASNLRICNRQDMRHKTRPLSIFLSSSSKGDVGITFLYISYALSDAKRLFYSQIFISTSVFHPLSSLSVLKRCRCPFPLQALWMLFPHALSHVLLPFLLPYPLPVLLPYPLPFLLSFLY